MNRLTSAIVRLIDSQFRPLANIFELAIALAWSLVGLSYVLDPDAELRSPLASPAEPYDFMWSILYLLALPLIWAGILKFRPHWRVAGLILLATGLLLQGTIAVQHGVSDPRVFIYWVYAVAVGLRVAAVIRYFGTKTGV